MPSLFRMSICVGVGVQVQVGVVCVQVQVGVWVVMILPVSLSVFTTHHELHYLTSRTALLNITNCIT